MHVSVIKYANCKINTPARRYEKQFGPNEIYGVQLAGNKRKMCKVHLSSRKDCFLPFSTLLGILPSAVTLCESLATPSLQLATTRSFSPGSRNGVFIQIIFGPALGKCSESQGGSKLPELMFSFLFWSSLCQLSLVPSAAFLLSLSQSPHIVLV